MGSDVRQQEQQQVGQSGQVTQQQQPQQLYMSPQTENLSYMYSLVERLMDQLQTNKQRKEQLLWDVDVLSKQLSQKFNKSEVKGKDDLDVVIFQNFLNERDNLLDDGDNDNDDDKQGSDAGGNRLTILKRQNEQLKKIFESKTRLNGDTLSLLYYHEDALNEIVRHLRSDVLKSHEVFIERVRSKFNNEMIPKEDAEFSFYLENVKEIQKLIDFSQAYRSLLRLNDSEM
ncbi:hypothetical protein ZYGR_0S00980 [Zygosaccharomyces rouxii]|uniref:ZYRO0F04664p n=2 Tax=Zygosaccharomyces rouxii TaxID=4956 RepID=C5DXF6_ZYGRC|nr:uncharacterized protein ZYRO0F04664g [Zygosaccharomyces rouxii]KAH9199229.1 hypothetical protein LQ764DRAFT_127915 [Zygosaccharomyces rouxii]GAV49965.1 hypothetical protein ZYGR_0S00980 [Zygosaccharomyces rouxii]CAR28467.1 ZYRO0F04664p [Zygosaccharomyces rouxii]